MLRAFRFGTDPWDPSHRFETSWLVSPYVLFALRALFVSPNGSYNFHLNSDVPPSQARDSPGAGCVTTPIPYPPDPRTNGNLPTGRSARLISPGSVIFCGLL